MKLGSLLKNNDIKAEYYYCKRGLDERYNPDNVKESEERGYYTKDCGNLFSGCEVSWDAAKLIFDGIDIKFDLSRLCFADNVYLTMGEGSGVSGVEVFAVEADEIKKIGNFSPETGENIIRSDINIPLGVYTDKLVIRLHGNCMPVCIKELDIYGAWELDESVWPLPEKTEFTGGTIDANGMTTIRARNADELFVAEYLKEKFFDKCGIELSISDNGDIKMQLDGGEKDAYELFVKPEEVLLSGSNRRSLLYAADAFIQITDKKHIKCCIIENEDFMELRGFHIALFDKAQLSFMKNMVKQVFVPMHYNSVYLEIAGALRYEKYPEINEAWLECIEKYKNGEWPKPAHYGYISHDIWEKEEVRELCEFFESYGIEVIPEVQSWGHTQYITAAFPETAEKKEAQANEIVDLNLRDVPPSDFYHHSMCPNHEKYYDIIFGIADEVIEAVKPKRFVHMGHDEIYTVGACEICKNIPRGEIFAKEVTALNNYIKKHGLQMMIWSDMIQNEFYSTPDAIDKIPKDIIMLDFTWYFHMEQDIEDRILQHGFNMLIGNLYSSHYPRYPERSKKKGIIGAEVSAWVSCNEFTYGFEGKMYDFVMSASAMSSKGYDPRFRLTYNEIIKPILNKIRESVGGLKCEKTERSIDIRGEEKNIPFDIRGVVPYKGAMAVSLYNPCCEVEVDAYAEIITFANATDKPGSRVMWSPAFQIGEYVICFEDGSVQREPVTYAGSVYKYRSRYGEPIKSFYFRHEGYIGTYLTIPESGKTYNGEDYTISHYSIRNKTPEKKIKSVRINHFDDNDLEILLFDIKIK